MNLDFDSPEYKAFSKLSRAVADEDVAAVRKALKKTTPDAQPGNSFGDSLLMVAIASGRSLEVLRVLIEEGQANVDFKAPRGTARSVAKKSKRADVLALLEGQAPAAAPKAEKKKKAAAAPSADEAFVVWRAELEPAGWSLGALEGVEKDWFLLDGTAYGKTWPKSARFELKNEGMAAGPHRPRKVKQPQFTDALHNLDSVLVVSARLAEVLKALAGADVELLPVKLLGPDGKPTAEKYAIAHPVGSVDAIDEKKSKLVRSARGEIRSIRKLALDPSRVPATRQLFRLAGKGDLFLARRALADAVMALGPTGVRFDGLDQFGEG